MTAHKIVIGIFSTLYNQVWIYIYGEITYATRVAIDISVHKYRLSRTLRFQHPVTGSIIYIAVELSVHRYITYPVLFVPHHFLPLTCFIVCPAGLVAICIIGITMAADMRGR